MILIHLLIMRSEFVTQTDFQKNIRMFLKDVSTIAFIMRIEFYICICFPNTLNFLKIQGYSVSKFL